MDAALPERADAVVVGGGIVGAASAYYLARRGISVVLLERGAIGEEQSGRNWGFVRQQGRHPLELPLAMESNRIWQTLETELEADLEWTRGGNLALATSAKRLALSNGGWMQHTSGPWRHSSCPQRRSRT